MTASASAGSPVRIAEVGELPEHLAVPRVELARPLEADPRLLEAALVLVGHGQAEERALVLGVQGQGRR